MWMNEATCLKLLQMITPSIQRQDTNMWIAISPHECLSITLRYLATGHCLQDLLFSSGIATCTLSNIIPETCHALKCGVMLFHFKSK